MKLCFWTFAFKTILTRKSKTRVTSYEFKSRSCKFKSTSYEFKSSSCDIFFFLYIYIYNLHFFEEKIYSHQVFIYLNVPGIPVRRPLPNRQTDSWKQLDVWVLGVTCASLLTARHLLMNKKDKNSQYTNIKIMTIRRKT